MAKRLIILFVAIIIFISVVLYLMFSGPRMKVQAHIRAYEMPMPLPPALIVPVGGAPSLPTPAEAAALTNPLPETAADRARGKVYYEYYCIFCHGETGRGDGPVGLSYVPAPTDLQSPAVQSASDGELLRKMLLGTGHEPVLERIVPPQHRWYLVLYVRSLAKSQGAAQNAAASPLNR